MAEPIEKLDPEATKDYRVDAIQLWFHYIIIWPASIILILLLVFGGFDVSISAKFLTKIGSNLPAIWSIISILIILGDRAYSRYLEINGDKEPFTGKNILKGMLKRERKVNELAMLILERREQKLKALYKKYDLGDDINAEPTPS